MFQILFDVSILYILQLLLWWEAQSVIEKRVLSNKDYLVKWTEYVIQSQATIFQGGGGRDDDEEGGEDR